jgi:hypothetical protein
MGSADTSSLNKSRLGNSYPGSNCLRALAEKNKCLADKNKTRTGGQSDPQKQFALRSLP